MPVLRRVLPHTGAFPVRRGEADREAIASARAVLRAASCSASSSRARGRTRDEIGDARTGVAMSRSPRARRS